MYSNTDPDPTVLTSTVSTSSSVATKTLSNGVVAKRSLLASRMTSINRMSIPQHAPATLTFHNINYLVGSKSTANKQCLKCSKLPLFKARDPRQVLFDVSGQFKNGMNAILGKNFTYTTV